MDLVPEFKSAWFATIRHFDWSIAGWLNIFLLFQNSLFANWVNT
jgi:hypothetical protein